MNQPLQKQKQQPLKKKLITKFRPRIRSRHPSHQPLRKELPLMPFRSVVRLGSTTTEDDIRVQCNTVEAIKNSASKLLMKQCFSNADVTTAPWWTFTDTNFVYPEGNHGNGTIALHALPFPLIVKHIHGSRGTGNSKINNLEELQAWLPGKTLNNYIIEQFKTYLREYRLHVTNEGCFYTCRKMLKNDCPQEKKFQRHDDNCVWIMENNPCFDKPVNWDNIVADCVRALNSLGLDIGAFDLKMQSAKDQKGRTRENPEWIVIESCSAPSFGEVTTQKYIQEIPKILLRKHEESRI